MNPFELIRGDSNQMLTEHRKMEQEEDEVLRQLQVAALENRRKDAARYSVRAVDKTLADFEVMGFAGFTCTRDADGNLHIEGVPHDVPAYLKQA